MQILTSLSQECSISIVLICICLSKVLRADLNVADSLLSGLSTLPNTTSRHPQLPIQGYDSSEFYLESLLQKSGCAFTYTTIASRCIEN